MNDLPGTVARLFQAEPGRYLKKRIMDGHRGPPDPVYLMIVDIETDDPDFFVDISTGHEWIDLDEQRRVIEKKLRELWASQ